jgi:predicted CXXCH cytochrome family protein
MKKLLFALVLGAVLVFALTTIASADHGPHGSFTATTDACAGCHRAHTAQMGSNALLISGSIDALCLSCHGTGVTGAYTNVEDGVYRAGGTEGIPGFGLFGGGFVNTKMRTAWSGNANAFIAGDPGSSPTTSAHDTETPGTLWGSGPNSAVPFQGTANYTLECTSCHTPHGNGGWNTLTSTAKPSYRLLRYTPGNGSGNPVVYDSSGFELALTAWNNGPYAGFQINDPGKEVGAMNGKYWYTPNFFSDATLPASIQNDPTLNTGAVGVGFRSFGNGDYSVRAASARNPYRVSDTFWGGPYMKPANNATVAGVTYTQGSEWDYSAARRDISYFCAQCHDRYMNNGTLRGGTTPSGDALYAFRHSSGDYNVGGVVGSGGQSCLACHVSHGSSSIADDPSTPTLDGNLGSLAGDSALLRLDGRSLCLKCHASAAGFTVPVP